MGLTSAHDTPRQEAKDSPDALLLGTPNTPTPHNFLDIRKPIGGATSVKEHERVVTDRPRVGVSSLLARPWKSSRTKTLI